MQSIAMPSVATLSVIMPNVILPIVAAPSRLALPDKIFISFIHFAKENLFLTFFFTFYLKSGNQEPSSQHFIFFVTYESFE
jgi:dihydroorotase